MQAGAPESPGALRHARLIEMQVPVVVEEGKMESAKNGSGGRRHWVNYRKSQHDRQ